MATLGNYQNELMSLKKQIDERSEEINSRFALFETTAEKILIEKVKEVSSLCGWFTDVASSNEPDEPLMFSFSTPMDHKYPVSWKTKYAISGPIVSFILTEIGTLRAAYSSGGFDDGSETIEDMGEIDILRFRKSGHHNDFDDHSFAIEIYKIFNSAIKKELKATAGPRISKPASAYL